MWKTSGHWNFYRENMFTPMQLEDAEYQLKPMNCPFHILIYKDQRRSYRELPMRLAEFGTVYRYERSGVMHGLLRVRGFTQDDAHIFCHARDGGIRGAAPAWTSRFDAHEDLRIRQIRGGAFHLGPGGSAKYYAGDARAMGTGGEVRWNRRCASADMPFRRMPGEAAFYGPKIDIKLVDAAEPALAAYHGAV